MARSRRRNTRRTTSQRAAGLIALALPAPVQRIADTRFGSLLMLVGVPAMIVFGLLNVKWQDGFPTISLDHERAAELRRAASEGLNGLENQAASENWGQSVVGFLHAAQGPNHTHAPSFPSTTPQAPSTAAIWQQQQQLRYQQQQYAGQYQQNRYQQQPPYLQQYPTQSSQPAPTFNQFQTPSQQQWAGHSSYPGTNPASYGVNNYSANSYGAAAQPNAAMNGYPTGYPPQQPYPQQQANGYSTPPTGNGGQTNYNQGGQLLRY